MLLVVGGMIGLGKSSVAKILGEHFNSEVFYESVENSPTSLTINWKGILQLLYISFTSFSIHFTISPPENYYYTILISVSLSNTCNFSALK